MTTAISSWENEYESEICDIVNNITEISQDKEEENKYNSLPLGFGICSTNKVLNQHVIKLSELLENKNIKQAVLYYDTVTKDNVSQIKDLIDNAFYIKYGCGFQEYIEAETKCADITEVLNNASDKALYSGRKSRFDDIASDVVSEKENKIIIMLFKFVYVAIFGMISGGISGAFLGTMTNGGIIGINTLIGLLIGCAAGFVIGGISGISK